MEARTGALAWGREAMGPGPVALGPLGAGLGAQTDYNIVREIWLSYFGVAQPVP
jgi:hypothetical protein